MCRRRLWMTPNENSIRESLKILQLRLQWLVEFKCYQMNLILFLKLHNMIFSYVGFLQFIILKSALQIYSSLVLRRHSIRPEYNAAKVNLRILILKTLKIVLTEKPFCCLNYKAIKFKQNKK